MNTIIFLAGAAFGYGIMIATPMLTYRLTKNLNLSLASMMLMGATILGLALK